MRREIVDDVGVAVVVVAADVVGMVGEMQSEARRIWEKVSALVNSIRVVRTM